MDPQPLRAFRRLRAVPVLSRLLGKFLRRPALRAQGRLAAYGCVPAAQFVPELVPGRVSLRLRNLPVSRELAMFARAVRAGLGKLGQKELPCEYFYDAVGSALFEAITLLPEYGLTR